MKLSTKDITKAAMFAALAAVAAIIVRLGSPLLVPYSLVPFVVMLAGAMLGPRLGAISMSVYVLVGLIGIPVFASAPFGGPSYVFQPTFGFLLGFIGAAFIVGFIVRKQEKPTVLRYVLAMIAGIAVIYLIGLSYMYLIINLYIGKAFSAVKVIEVGFVPFIIFDLIKGGLAIAVTKAVMSRIPNSASN